MRCKQHPSDLSSTVGVCASCLRVRLVELIAAQAQAQAQSQSHPELFHRHQQVLHPAQVARAFSRSSAAVADVPSKSDPIPAAPPPLVFPRSVSPYVSRRKSDDSAWAHLDGSDPRLFYSTPQVGPMYRGVDNSISGSTSTATTTVRKYGRFWILSKLFRSRSDKFVSDPSRVTCEPSSSYSSPSWFSSMFPGGRRRNTRPSSLDDSVVKSRRRCRRSDRGMSPALDVDLEEDCDISPSGNEHPTELSSPRLRKTPQAALPSTARRSRHRYGRNVTGMAFCLSPLVRPSPNRPWNLKGMSSELVLSGEARVPARSQSSSTVPFCKNRSKKLVDLGKANLNR